LLSAASRGKERANSKATKFSVPMERMWQIYLEGATLAVFKEIHFVCALTISFAVFVPLETTTKLNI